MPATAIACGEFAEGGKVQGWWAASYVVLWLLVLALCVVVVALARQIGTLHLRLGPRGALEIDDEGPPLGEAIEPYAGTDITGAPVSVAGPGRAQLLLFVSPGCRMCEEVIPGIPALVRGSETDPILITDVDARESELTYRARVRIPVIAGAELVRLYGVPGTPFAVVLDATGVVRAKGTINNLEQLEGLMDTALRRLSSSESRQAG